MRPQGVRDTFNGIIASLREEGYSLREIGEHCGVSSQRIHQILSEDYPNQIARPDNLVTRDAFAQLVGCSAALLYSLEKKGVLTPIQRGGYRHIVLYDKADVRQVKALINARRGARKARTVQLICKTCGHVFERTVTSIRKTSPGHFCSKKCLGVFVGTHYGFIKHPENAGRGRRRPKGIDRIVNIPVNPTSIRLLQDIAYTHNVLSKRD